MPIEWSDDARQLHLHNGRISLVLRVLESGHLGQLHLGQLQARPKPGVGPRAPGGIGQPLARAREANGGALDGTVVAALIADDDPGALEALRELGDWLGQACASIGAVLDPQVFVFGGGVAMAGDRLLDPVRESFLAHLPARGFHPEPQFLVAQLVNDAGVVGAADLARIHAGSSG